MLLGTPQPISSVVFVSETHRKEAFCGELVAVIPDSRSSKLIEIVPLERYTDVISSMVKTGDKF